MSSDMDSLVQLFERGFISREEYEDRAKDLGISAGSGEMGSVSEEVHDSSTCSCNSMTCFKCGMFLKECVMQDHDQVCVERDRNCVVCGGIYQQGQMLTHMLECVRKHAQKRYNDKQYVCACGKLQYETAEDDHSELCFAVRKCPCCGLEGDLPSTLNHMLTCPKWKIYCIQCHKRFRRSEYEDHECPTKHINYQPLCGMVF